MTEPIEQVPVREIAGGVFVYHDDPKAGVRLRGSFRSMLKQAEIFAADIRKTAPMKASGETTAVRPPAKTSSKRTRAGALAKASPPPRSKRGISTR